ncbi:Radical SAM domain protein [Oleidesulfovibrio alaskensis G20]|uniref:Radical SAM domain protein n=1 Tax=Oleidesulfovibrio alaskensis (strain ATCC BAA-1058 / DSM 17464 / G20) TaxID=207559 RepID=Q311C3_OLEA2|nr:radical SAM protein [Oleidesulfovibrio alaskensis]ABB38473.1 Radical SAM domain protein [Oleidesulfovibrio alaskensis G20]MBG0773513.1 radical SAM protein [Oleidesulfovibrio alaskensis]
MASSRIQPRLLVADKDGNIYDHPDLLMVCRRGHEFAQPRPDELMPLPEESDLFLLPGRQAVGLSEETGEIEALEELAVAAFAAPAHTLTAHAAYISSPDAPTLPLFAYGAVGYANGRFYICAKRVDQDERQVFSSISKKRIKQNAHALMKAYPENRLMQHLMSNCALTYCCPAARNLALGRYEAPLPTSRSCNARCVGCISQQEDGSRICSTPQNRLSFTPTPEEIAEVMLHHGKAETEKPVFSFGQGCEGEPLTEANIIAQAVHLFRSKGGTGTVNVNTNASLPQAVIKLAEAGISSIRVSLNSAREEVYNRYYRPRGYTFADVRSSIAEAHKRGVFVSLNLLYFPGISDCELELQALDELIGTEKVDFVQLRNLNIDPEMYLELLDGIEFGPSAGFINFRRRLRKSNPWLQFGYFNPYLPQNPA